MTHHDHVTMPWADSIWPWKRCRARKESRCYGRYSGRCDLAAGHTGDHALERGFDTPRWSTDWTGF